jgi:hypothetical protein
LDDFVLPQQNQYVSAPRQSELDAISELQLDSTTIPKSPIVTAKREVLDDSQLANDQTRVGLQSAHDTRNENDITMQGAELSILEKLEETREQAESALAAFEKASADTN